MSSYDKQLSRSPLELGALGGTLQERTAVMLGRCAVWSLLLGRPHDSPLTLRLMPTGGGRTSLETGEVFIPQDDPENPLVLEHELSHHAFGSDMDVQNRAVGTALTGYMAACRVGLSQADTFTLSTFLHGVFNMLDDLRVCSLWETLYPYSAALLRKRWKEIAGTIPAERVNADLLTAVVVVAAGARLSSRVSPVVQGIAPAIEAAARRCVRTDINGLAAVFLDLARALQHLMGQEPPQPPSPQGSGGPPPPPGQPTKGLGQSGAGQPPPPGKNSPLPQRSPPPGAPPPPQAPPGDLGTRQIQNILAKQSQVPLPNGSLGTARTDKPAEVPKRGAGEELLRARVGGRQVPLSGTDEEVPTYMPSVDDVVEAGMDAMQALADKYLAAMTLRASSQDPSGGEVGQAWVTVAAASAGITAHQVAPGKGLPPPSPQAVRLRRMLESVRRSRRRRKTWDGGTLDIDVVVSSLSEDNWDNPLCVEELKAGGLDLLVLVDVSGSMSGEPTIKQLNQSISDLLHACKASPHLKLHQWCFSDDLFMFHKPGGFVSEVEWGCTNMIAALEMAGAWARRLSRQRAVLLITDGEPTALRAKGSTGDRILDLVKVTEELRAQRVSLEAVLMRDPSAALQKVFRTKGLPAKAEVGPELVKAAGRIMARSV